MSGTPLKVGPKLAGTLGPLLPTGRHQKWVQAFALSLVHFYPKHFVETDFDETWHGQAHLINKAPVKGISRSDIKWPRYGDFKLTLLREHVKPKLKVIPRKVKNFVETDFDETRHGQAHMINKATVKGISPSDIKLQNRCKGTRERSEIVRNMCVFNLQYTLYTHQKWVQAFADIFLQCQTQAQCQLAVKSGLTMSDSGSVSASG